MMENLRDEMEDNEKENGISWWTVKKEKIKMDLTPGWRLVEVSCLVVGVEVRFLLRVDKSSTLPLSLSLVFFVFFLYLPSVCNGRTRSHSSNKYSIFLFCVRHYTIFFSHILLYFGLCFFFFFIVLFFRNLRPKHIIRLWVMKNAVKDNEDVVKRLKGPQVSWDNANITGKSVCACVGNRG